jgi:copper chaperone CopZ
MRRIGVGIFAVAACAAALVGMVLPETKVEVKGLHLCCGGCVSAATGAVSGAGGKDAKGDKDSGTLTFSAPNEKAAQRALDALAAAGFHGDTGNKALAMKDESVGPKPVKMTTVTLKGIHNCCEGCAKPIKAAIEKVEGVTSEDVKAKETTLTVKGNFDLLKLYKALYDAGYHATVDTKAKK